MALLSSSSQSGMLEDANCPPEASMFKMTVDPKDAPDKAEKVEMEVRA